jgi:hypothetical protein
MNRDHLVAANWRLPLMPGHRTSQVTALRQALGAHTFPLTLKNILPITERRSDRTGMAEKWRVKNVDISVFTDSVAGI